MAKDWTGKTCPKCDGTGQNDDASRCDACAGTGDEYGEVPAMTPPTAPDTGAIRERLEMRQIGQDSEEIFRKHAPADIAALLAEKERLRADNERLHTALKAAQAFLFPGPGTCFKGTIEDAEKLVKEALAKKGDTP